MTPTLTELNALERSFADFAARHRLTNFGVDYRGAEKDAAYLFSATGHFDDAQPGEIACASAYGATIAEAIRGMLSEATRKRTPVETGNVLADAPLVADAA